MPTHTPPPYSVQPNPLAAERGPFRTRYVSPWKLRAILAWNAARWLGRRATSFARPLPTFVIIGAAKAGTTSLLAYLGEQPDVGVSVRKEVRYFDFNADRSSGWYRAHFPSALFWLAVRLRRGHWPQVGEATPFYLDAPEAPARMHALAPRMKLIVLVRDPARRAFSHYEHSVRVGQEELSFPDALAAEDGRLRADETSPPLEAFLHGYVDGSRYGRHLARWLTVFPPEQILVLVAEDLFERPAEVCAAAAEFLGVDATRLRGYPTRNSAEYEGPPQEWLDDVRARLDDDTETLEQLLGRCTPWSG